MSTIIKRKLAMPTLRIKVRHRMNKSFSASLLPAFSDLHPQRFCDLGLRPTHGGNALLKYRKNYNKSRPTMRVHL